MGTSTSKTIVTNTDRAEQLIVKSLAKFDSLALGVALGTVFSLIIFTMTIILVIKGGELVGPNLSLLNQYFIGYEVSSFGSLVGALYGFVSGFVLGWLIASVRNVCVSIYVNYIKFKSNVSSINEFIDNP
jgi:divalent metal cation (Fe/Co/Zn/Cd) transporter